MLWIFVVFTKYSIWMCMYVCMFVCLFDLVCHFPTLCLLFSVLYFVFVAKCFWGDLFLLLDDFTLCTWILVVSNNFFLLLVVWSLVFLFYFFCVDGFFFSSLKLFVGYFSYYISGRCREVQKTFIFFKMSAKILAWTLACIFLNANSLILQNRNRYMEYRLHVHIENIGWFHWSVSYIRTVAY